MRSTHNIVWKKFLPLGFSLVFIGVLALTITILKKTGYHVIYNVTASMPRGFYLIIPLKKISRYDIVEFIPSPQILNFVKDKHWAPQSGSIVKYVFGMPNDYVEKKNQAIWINGKKIGKVYKLYAKNKLLPQTEICGKLKKDEYLLLSTKSEHSFDSRYFGIVTLPEILGHAIPIFIHKVN